MKFLPFIILNKIYVKHLSGVDLRATFNERFLINSSKYRYAHYLTLGVF